MTQACMICRMLLWHLTRLACSRALVREGIKIAIRMAMMPTTTSSSTILDALRLTARPGTNEREDDGREERRCIMDGTFRPGVQKTGELGTLSCLPPQERDVKCDRLGSRVCA